MKKPINSSTNEKSRTHSGFSFDKNIGLLHLFWITPVFQALHDTRELKNLLESKEAAQDPAFLYGFKALLRIIFRKYLQDFEADSFLRLRSDKRTKRAIFAGIVHSRIPPACEKARSIINLGSIFDNICSSKGADDLIANIEKAWTNFILPLDNIFQANVSVEPRLASKISKSALLQLIGVQFLWQYAHNIRRLVPHVFHETLAEDNSDRTRRQQWDHAFLGYKLGLAFICKAQRELELQSTIEAIGSALTWKDLAISSNRIRETLATSEAELGVEFGHSTILTSNGHPEKAVLRDLIQTPPKLQLSKDEKFDETFMWYQIQIIDSAASRIFSGIPAFISLLIGEIYQRRRSRSKVEIFRIMQGFHDVSYGILMERRDPFYDASGWLIFHKVTWREEKTAGGGYYLAEGLMRNFRKHVKVSELQMSDKDLTEFRMFKIKQELSNIGGSLTENEIMALRIEQLERHRKRSREALLVFLTRTYYEAKGFQVKPFFEDHNILPKKMEIDLLVTNEQTRELAVVECSMRISFDEIDNFVTKMNSKLQYIRDSNDYSCYSSYSKVFSTSAETLRRIRSISVILSKLTANEISVITVEDDIMRNLPSRIADKVSLEIWDQGDFALSDD